MYVCIYFKEITTFIQQGCIKLIKSDTKRDIYNVTKDLFQICCSFEKKKLSKNPKNNIYKSIKKHTVSNTDNNNNKCFLSSKSAY